MQVKVANQAVIQFETDLKFARGSDPKKQLIAVFPSLKPLFQQFPEIAIKHRYDHFDAAALERIFKDANGAPDHSFHPDMCFSMDLKLEDSRQVVQSFNMHPHVRHCEFAVEAGDDALENFTASDVPVASDQSYFEDFPRGNDLFTVSSSVSYARGDDLRIFTIGKDFWREHQEFKYPRHPIRVPKPLFGPSLVGTPIMGILTGSLNSGSMRGGLPWAEHIVLPSTDANNSLVVDQSIMYAIANGQEGDVIVITEWAGSVNGFDNVPVECAEIIWNAIRKATDLGFVVVEAAGDGRRADGGRNLDSFYNESGHHILDPSKPSEFRDSGAILVGSSQPRGVGSYEPTDRSNFGARLTSFADGTNIWSAVDTPNFPATYNFFEGNLYSTAVVACAIGITQSAFKGIANIILPASTMRSIINLSGKKSTGLGFHPRLKNVLPRMLRFFDDVYVRDYVGDDGSRHSRTSGLSASPDIIVRRNAYPNNSQQTAIGQGSGQENNNRLSQPVKRGANSFVYIRGLNRSINDAYAVIADVYYAKPSVLTTPDKWNKVGQAFFESAIQAGNKLQVSAALEFDTLDVPSGHYCMIALIYSASDRAPNVGKIKKISHWVDFIRNNNNVAWRNFNVVGKKPNVTAREMSAYRYDAGVPFPASLGLELEVTSDLPAGTYVGFEVPDAYGSLFEKTTRSVRPGVSFMDIAPKGTETLIKDKEVPLGLNMALIFEDLSNTPDDEEYEIFVRYLFNGIEIGRQTWVINSSAYDYDQDDDYNQDDDG